MSDQPPSSQGKLPRSADTTTKPECFVVMPVTDPEGEAGHFRHVFEDVFAPACEMAGYRAQRADQVRETDLIHLDILKRLLDSPVVLCDLSRTNPNVMFELGLRQAFDRPVVLVQEVGTRKIFDIAPLRYTEYRRSRIYHEVLEDQKNIAKAIVATVDASKGGGVNSIVRILALNKGAAIPEVRATDRDPGLQLVMAEISALRDDVRQAVGRKLHAAPPPWKSRGSEALQHLAHRIENLESMLTHSLSEEHKQALLSELSDLDQLIRQRISLMPHDFAEYQEVIRRLNHCRARLGRLIGPVRYQTTPELEVPVVGDDAAPQPSEVRSDPKRS